MKRPAPRRRGIVVMLVATGRLVPQSRASLAPSEDQGYVFVIRRLQQAASLQRTDAARRAADRRRAQHPGDRRNDVGRGHGSADVRPAHQCRRASGCRSRPGTSARRPELSRGGGRRCVVRRRAQVSRMRIFFAVEPPPIEGMSNTGGFEGYIQSRGQRLRRRSNGRLQKFVPRPQAQGAAGVGTTYSANVPQMRIDLDREKAITLGVPCTTCSTRCRARSARCT